MFDEMMEVGRKGQEGLELDEGLMEVLGLSDLLELEKGDGMEADEGGFLLCPPSSISTSSSSSTQMLSFGGVAQKSSDSSSLSTLSSSPPSTTTTSATSNSNRTSKMSKKVENSGRGGGGRRTEGDATTMANTSKRPKTGVSSSSSTIKVRKEKLGERIMALQQLVSPFGKSDTASVLHEALGYIRFLHDQVQVLSTPYLQRLPHLHDGVVESVGDLRSRGLCLVPISCTEHVADSNGADLWSPSIGSND